MSWGAAWPWRWKGSRTFRNVCRPLTLRHCATSKNCTAVSASNVAAVDSGHRPCFCFVARTGISMCLPNKHNLNRLEECVTWLGLFCVTVLLCAVTIGMPEIAASVELHGLGYPLASVKSAWSIQKYAFKSFTGDWKIQHSVRWLCHISSQAKSRLSWNALCLLLQGNISNVLTGCKAVSVTLLLRLMTGYKDETRLTECRLFIYLFIV